MIDRRRALGLLGLGLAALALSGCGRKGRPEEVENAVYPRLYPFTPYPGQPVPPAPAQPAGAGELRPVESMDPPR